MLVTSLLTALSRLRFDFVARRGAGSSRVLGWSLSAGLALCACGTNAARVEECRQIEVARCRSAAQCGLIPDLAACERYVADECRHGFPPNLGPSSSSVTACVKAIDDIAACAKRSGKKTPPEDCSQSSLNKADAKNVCELVEHPERIPRCSFLDEPKSKGDETNEDETADASNSEPTAPGNSTEAATTAPDDKTQDAGQ